MPPTKPKVKLLTPVRALKGVGQKRASAFEKAGIHTLEDLLHHFPIRYEDRRTVRTISSLRAGETALVQGEIVDARIVPTRRRNFQIFAIALRDDSGVLQAVWFNQPWVAEALVPGKTVALFGAVDFARDRRTLQMANAKFEMGETASATGVTPVYQRARDVGGWVIRKLIANLLERYDIDAESLTPLSVRKRMRLLPLSEAFRRIHHPPVDVDLDGLNQARDPAHRSLIFEEFFMLQAGIALRTAGEKKESGVSFRTSPEMRRTLKKMLPFRLTEGQRAAFRDIVADMTAGRPMRRLMQGDVGCGKTIVALLSAALAIENGYQAALMAPTEILAEQHLSSVRAHLDHTNYRVELLTGSLSAAERKRVRAALAEGEVDLVIGTHALIQEDVRFHKLGLAIIDEQHRFGVLQRARLLQPVGGAQPDLLIMTATPIPRSLMLTLFGDLSVSTIRDMPPGRTPVVTAARTERSRPRINRFLEEEMRAGRQVFAVAPVIEESGAEDLETAKAMYERLKKTFPNRRVGLLHGRMKRDEREAAMRGFLKRDIDILACTTVIEVGVDVPNASVMLIENAERFGLAQLHQLRGRVGRGSHKSWCILLYQPTRTDNARERLEIMVKTSDGFEIAEKDLELRGPGEFFGARQSGVPGLRMGHILRDMNILQTARKAAFDYIASDAPEHAEEKRQYIERLRAHWERRYGLVLVG